MAKSFTTVDYIPRTPSFPGSVKPEHPGIYRVIKVGLTGTRWAYWNGRAWSHGCRDDFAPAVEKFVQNSAAFPVQEWWGLAGEPK